MLFVYGILAAPPSEGLAPAISLTDNALKHLNKMQSERNEDLCLRIGVRQGGCSGMSYTMEFENSANARPDDSIIEYNGFVIGTHFTHLNVALNLIMNLFNWGFKISTESQELGAFFRS